MGGSSSSAITFTRASEGTYFGSDGLLKTAGTDIARFDHNPETLAPRGLLIEGRRTNLLLWNRDLTNAAWTASNVTVAKTATGIDGVSNSASRLTATSNNGTVLQSVTSASAARATTAYVRRVSGTGTVEMTQNGGTNWTAVTVTGSWTRVGPASATITNPSVGFRLVTSGDVIEVDYVQLESASFPSSAIATTTTSMTRAADFPVVSVLSTIGFNQNEGTLITEFEPVVTDGAYGIAGFGSATTGNEIYMRFSASPASTVIGRVAHSTGTTQQMNTANTGIVGARNVAAIAYQNLNSAVVLNGGAVVPLTTATVPTVDRFRIGASLPSGGSERLYGWFRRLVYYPTRLPDFELQRLTQ